jgi:hypothetical protein
VIHQTGVGNLRPYLKILIKSDELTLQVKEKLLPIKKGCEKPTIIGQ